MFLALAHMVGATQVMGWGGVGVGWGGDGNVHWTCTHGRCYATSCSLHLHTWSVLRKSWDGVGLGWGGVGMVTFIELAHMVGAMQHHVPCTCTHGRCYATSCSLHLHTWSVLRKSGMGWGWGGVGWGGDGNVHWTCTHGRCYATSCSLHLHTWSVLRKSWDGVGLGWGGVGMVTFIELAHMVGATQHHVPLPF